MSTGEGSSRKRSPAWKLPGASSSRPLHRIESEPHRLCARRGTPTHYNYARDYDPATGRYVESDPIGLNGGSYSTYAYVAANPIAVSDRFGLLVCNGRWRRMGELVPTLGILWQTLTSNSCKCFWLCTSCNGQDMWSGNIYSLPSTSGQTVVIYGGDVNPGSGGIRPTPRGPSGGPSSTMGGSAKCACKSPGPETGCTQCYPNSRYPDGLP